MRIRTKLTGLLVLFAATPLAVVAVGNFVGTKQIAADISTATADALRDRRIEAVEAWVMPSARRIESRLETGRLASEVLLQAYERAAWLGVESGGALQLPSGVATGASPSSSVTVPSLAGEPSRSYLHTRFGGNTSSPISGLQEIPGVHFSRDARGEASSIPVSLSTGSYLPPLDGDSNGDGAPMPAPGRARLRAQLESLVPAMRSIVRDGAAGIQATWVVDQSGGAITFPGVGPYPEGFDSRSAGWYRSAVEAGDAVWSGPWRDQATGQMRVACSAPVFGGAGVVGVVATEILLVDLIEQVADLRGLPVDGTISIATGGSLGPTGQAGSSTPTTGDPVTVWVATDADAGVRVRAEATTPFRGGQAKAAAASGVRVGARFGVTSDGQLVMGSELTTRSEVGSRSAAETSGGTEWFFAPITTGFAIAASVPVGGFDVAGIATSEEIQSRAGDQLRLGLFAAITAMVFALGIAYVAAKTVTRPIRRLAVQADRVAAGDLEVEFDARFTAKGDDEIARLARDFRAMVPRLAKSVRTSETLALARELRDVVLPTKPPIIPGFDVHGYCRYCDDAGGDYFDFLRLEPSGDGDAAHAVAIGDVAGHGVPAALLMTAARALIKSHAAIEVSPPALLRRVNAPLFDQSRGGRFMSLVYMRLDADARLLRWANAGHEPPMVYHPERDVFEELSGAGLPVAVEEHAEYDEHAAPYPAPGAVVFMGTDGVWEARGENGEHFGMDRLRAIIRDQHDAKASHIAAAIHHALDDFRGDQPMSDDVTFVVLRVEGSAS
ncbi:MAG: SpoIIE family protein phosphatase [Planctomycetota bacterium]